MDYRLIGPDERSQWNNFVSNSARGHVFQSYEWGEVNSRLGWTPLRMVVEDGSGHIKACISLLKRKVPATPWSILYGPRGPVLDFEDEESYDRLMAGINRVAASHGAVFAQINPHAFEEDSDIPGKLLQKGFAQREKPGLFRLTQPKYVYRMDLEKSEEQLLSSMKPKTRYNIQLALKKGVEITETMEFDDLRKFYELLKRTSARKHFPHKRFSYFRAIWKEMAPNGLATIFFASHKGEVLSGILLFVFGNMCWYMYGASDDRRRDVMPNHALHWRIMQWAKARGCRWYDLRGVPSFKPYSGHSGYGVYRFKKSFGGLPITFLGDYYLVCRPKLNACWENGERLLNRFAGLLLKISSG